MAKAVVEGALKVADVKATVTTPDKITEDELINADAIILGSPTYYGNMAAPMKAFIDDWALKYECSLVGKVGGAFSTGAGETGGKEHVIYSLVISMMNAGMIIVGPVEGQYGMVGASALDPVGESGLKEARTLGERAARIALKIKY
jgi:NAD(P)H dehydrogenase (quinone)